MSVTPADPETIMAALRIFEERLKWADGFYLGTHQRIGILCAVTAAIEFLGAAKLSGLEGPFIKLAHALHDLDSGTVPPLFKVADRGPGRPHPIENQRLAGLAGCGMQALMDLKYSKTDASKLIAKQLQALGIPIGNMWNATEEDAAKTVAYWRDTAKSGNRIKDPSAQVYYSLLEEFRLLVAASTQAGEARDTIKREILEGLEPVCRRLGLPNPSP